MSVKPAAYLALALVLLLVRPAVARDASFMDPGLATPGGAAGSTDAVVVEPKGDIDTGESILNIARRTTLFFVNQTSLPVEVAGVTVNGDGNVKSDIVSDDCSKGGRIAPTSRCSVIVEVTPTSPGPWGVEVLMTHNGSGRIARAKLSGKGGGTVAAEKKDNGLSLSAKEAAPISFGEVETNGGKAVRSALMINDSPDTITLISIDIIGAENGLERLDQGCVIDMDLKPGESCPVTMVWKPTLKGQVSTDLIIRHTGKLGFAVIPIRGTAKEDADTAAREAKAKDDADKASSDKNAKADKGKVPLPPGADELEKLTSGKIPPVAAEIIGKAATATVSGSFHLIGTVGNRAVLLKPDGTTTVVDIGDAISYGDGNSAKIVSVAPKGAEIFMDGKKHALVLEAAAELTAKAALQAQADAAVHKSDKPGDKTASASLPGNPGGSAGGLAGAGR